jgi:diguanylate cyclase (GGDEF)-like protein/PAS domain S-box-containing protein
MDVDDAFYRKLLDNLYEGIYFMDADRRITYWNRAATKITGYGASEVVHSFCRDNILMHVDENGSLLCAQARCPAAKAIADGRVREAEIYLHHKQGHRVPVKVRVLPISGTDGIIIGAVEIFSDNTYARISRHDIEELRRLALLDPLTEVGNRRFGDMSLKSRLAQQERYDWLFGLVFIDIDDFKSINDSFGHKVGDDVLLMITRTITNSLRSFDVVYRWGGEEFIAIVVNVDEERLGRVAEKLRAMVEQSSISIDSTVVRATVSLGATLALPNDTADSLVKRADRLMYESKRAGRNRVTLG